MAGIKSRAGARTEYRIYPSIGIARVGNSKDGFFIGPEAPGIAPEGPFRSADGIKPQGARFRIYRLDIDSNENDNGDCGDRPKDIDQDQVDGAALEPQGGGRENPGYARPGAAARPSQQGLQPQEARHFR